MIGRCEPSPYVAEGQGRVEYVLFGENVNANCARPPKKNRELSVDLLITFIHMNSEGVVIIDGAEGTPGAGWCVTIAASDSDGCEYIITEHRRDTGAPPADADDRDSPGEGAADRCDKEDSDERAAGQRPGSALSNADTFEVRDPEGGTMMNADIITKHLSVDVREVGSEGDSDGGEFQTKGSGASSCSEREQQPESGTEVGGGEQEDKAAERKEYDGGDSLRKEGCGSDPTERQPHYIPTPPQRKSNSSASEEEMSAPSVAKRFAKWIVKGAHMGGKKGDNAEQDKESKPPPQQEKNNGGGASEASNPDGDGKTPSAVRGEVDPPSPTSPGVRRSKAVSVKGFVPVRAGSVSMTCPLPTKLPFHPDQVEEEFDAPTFGTTVLGNSHGFDPRG